MPGSERTAGLLRPAVFAPMLLVLAAGVSLWFAGYRLAGNDEGALLTAAAKILRGGVFYRDVDAYPLPGATYLLASAMALFGEHLSVARALAGAIYCLIALCLYRASLRFLSAPAAALFGVSLLGYKFFAWPGFTAFYYWDASLLGACVAIACFLAHPFRGASLALVGAGIGAGVALVCKQSAGLTLAAAALAFLALARALPGAPPRSAGAVAAELGSFAVGLAVPLLPLVLYFGWHGLLDEMLYSGFVRPFTAYLPTSGVSFLAPLRWWEFGRFAGSEGFPYLPEPWWIMLRRGVLPGEALYPLYRAAGEAGSRAIYASVPLAFLLVGAQWLRAARRGRGWDERALAALWLLTLAVVLSAFPRADFAHVIGVHPPVLLLLAVGAARATRGAGRAARNLRRAAAGAAALGVAGGGALAAVHHASMTHRMRLERADLRVPPQDSYVESVVRFVQEELRPGDALFVYGHEAYYYFLTGHHSPWPFSQLYPGQAGEDGGRALAERLAERTPALVIQGAIHFPGVPPIPSYAPLLHAWVQANFEPDGRVFRRHPPPGGTKPGRRALSVLRPRAATR